MVSPSVSARLRCVFLSFVISGPNIVRFGFTMGRRVGDSVGFGQILLQFKQVVVRQQARMPAVLLWHGGIMDNPARVSNARSGSGQRPVFSAARRRALMAAGRLRTGLYFRPDFFAQACFLSSSWHLRICAGVHSPGLPFRFHGFWHTGFLAGTVLLLSADSGRRPRSSGMSRPHPARADSG